MHSSALPFLKSRVRAVRNHWMIRCFDILSPIPKRYQNTRSKVIRVGWMPWRSVLAACWFIGSLGIAYSGGAEVVGKDNFQADATLADSIPHDDLILDS